MSCTKALVLLLLIASHPNCMGLDNETMCSDGEYNCASCYDILASQAIDSARNRFNLQRGFFPPDRENPVYLEVTYKFNVNTTNGPIDDDDENKTVVWFWTDSPFYLFQPIEVIQFTSLLFADYANRKYNVTLYLPRSCYNASESNFKLFTQRLKLYAMKQKLYPEIDDIYIPKATTVDILKNFHETLPFSRTSRITLAFQIFFPILTWVFAFTIWVYIWDARDGKGPTMRETLTHGSGLVTPTNCMESLWTLQRLSVDHTILSSLVASLFAYIYVLVLDIMAMVSVNQYVSENVMKYYSPGQSTINFNIEYSIVFVIFVEDLIVMIAFIALIVILSSTSCKKCSEYNTWSMFVYAPLGPMMCAVNHTHHIIIGFVHTPYHAGSILISYGVIIIVFLTAFRSSHYTIARFCYKEENKRHCLNICAFFTFLAICIVLSSLAVLMVAIFLLVPIDNAIDDAPSQLISVERIIIVLLGVSVAYKVYSMNSDSLISYIVKGADEETGEETGDSSEWKTLEVEEKYVKVGRTLYTKYLK